jgi:hypothetical protein
MTAFAQRQRVEVGRTLYGVPTFDVATVVDLPTEDTVRVVIDGHAEHPRVIDAELILPIPGAVSRHITRLIEALGAVTDEERADVEAELQHRLLGHDNLVDYARMVAAATSEIAEAVQGGRA